MDGDWLRCPPGLLLVAALFFVPGGCKQGPADDDDSTSPDPVCDQGFVQDSELPEAFLEEFPDGCVPEECAVGRWGGLTVDADTVYVDASGPDVGDGSEEAPYRVLATHPFPGIPERQIARIRKVKGERDNDQVQRALKELREATLSNENVMPPVMEAVKAYATIGEICGIMREKWGEFKSPTYI